MLKKIATWTLTLLLCAMLLNAGLRKFFEARTAPYGAATIIAVMLGAIGMFAMHGRMQHSVSAIVSLVVAGIVLALRWRVRYSFQRRMDSIM